MRRSGKQNTTNLHMMMTAALFVAFAVVGGSTIILPLGGVKGVPAQHLINVLAAVFLGPGWSVGIAFTASLLRNLMGTGTPLAFPGSMIGALLAGLAFELSKRAWVTAIAEVIGTGVLGAIAGSLLSRFVMGNPMGMFALIPGFLASTVTGSILALILLPVLTRITRNFLPARQRKESS